MLHADHWSAGEFYVDTELAAWHAEESFLGLDKLGGDADDAMLEDETPDSIGISDCRSMSCDDLLADNTLATPAARADALTDSCDGTRFEQQVPSTHEQQNGLVANVELGLYGGMTNDETDYVDPDIALSAFHATLGAPYVFRDDMDILLGNYVTELVGGEVEGWSVASVGAHMVAVLDVEDPDLGFCASTYMMPSYHLVPVLDHHREHSPLHTATLKTAD